MTARSHPWRKMPTLDVNKAIARYHGKLRLGVHTQQAWSDVMFAFRQCGWHVTSAPRAAARYAALVGCTQDEAAAAFGVDRSSVSKAKIEMRTGNTYLRAT